jgi:hypothetical protein
VGKIYENFETKLDQMTFKDFSRGFVLNSLASFMKSLRAFSKFKRLESFKQTHPNFNKTNQKNPHRSFEHSP